MLTDISEMLQSSLKARLDTSRFDIALPSPDQMKNEIFGDLGSAYGTPQGHIGALMGALVPQWAEHASRASKAGKKKSVTSERRTEQKTIKKGLR